MPFRNLDADALRGIVQALLRESGAAVAVSRRGDFVDFDVRLSGALSQTVQQRFRLFFEIPTASDFVALVSEADTAGLRPVAIAPRGIDGAVTIPVALTVIRPAELHRLCEESGIVIARSDGFEVDRDALRELQDYRDPRIALLNGLLWLRPLSRDRIPPALRWTKTPAHELFERCFFLSAVSTFGTTGTRWGTGQRGVPLPDGRLTFPALAAPVLYDCKASRQGYKMEYRDLTGFADYLNHPLETNWRHRRNQTVYFLVVSSDFADSNGRLFDRRQKELSTKAKGAQLVWMRAPDLARFGLAVERGNVSQTHRRLIRWKRLLSAGNIQWTHFSDELSHLSACGYSFDGL